MGIEQKSESSYESESEDDEEDEPQIHSDSRPVQYRIINNKLIQLSGPTP